MPAWLSPEIITLLVNGLLMTIALGVITSALAMVLGVGLGWMKLSVSGLMRGVSTIYIEVFRNVPALVSIIFWAYALPNIFPLEVRRNLFFDNGFVNLLGDVTGLSIPYYVIAAALGLTLNTSAYVAELFRAGVGTLSREHWEAARTLGASPRRAFMYVLLPQGLRAAAPALVTRLVHNLKNTALASFVAVPELFKAVQTAISQSFFAVELLLVASVLYWLLSWGFAGVLRWVLPSKARGAQ
jgi:His/Glu/Gln/Arg/opine family amino acid ABC transporter permease subunit